MVDCLCPSAAFLRLQDRRDVAHRGLVLAARAHAAISMDGQSLPAEGIQDLLASVIPETVPKTLELVPTAGPYLHYRAEAALDGAALMLSFTPRVARLLRSERSAMRSEVALLQWLARSGAGNPSTPANILDQSKPDRGDCSDCGANYWTCNCTSGRLLSFLPQLMGHGTARHLAQGEYIITRPAPGMPRAALGVSLDTAQQDDLDLQTGRLLRHLSSQVSPNGKFGTALAILSPRSGDESAGRVGERASTPDRDSCYEKWSDAFISLLESALRDAEDFKVAIRYEAVRDHVNRFKHFLDAVSMPRLVVVDAGEEQLTLVTPVGSEVDIAGRWCDMHGPDDSLLKARQLASPTAGPNGEEASDSDSASQQAKVGQGRVSASFVVTGIRGLGNSVFGDPLFASVLSRNATPKIWSGFMPVMAERLSATTSPHHGSLLDDAAHIEVRRLLYECHHAVVAIVREYCRRQSDSDDREMPARKRLTQALRRLDSMDDRGVVWRQLYDDDVYPVKRQKPDNGEAGDG